MAAGDIFEILVQPRANETHTSQTLTLDGVRVRMDFYTNRSDGLWYMDLFDSQNNAMVMGIGLATGLDLFFPYRYLDVPPGVLFVNDHLGALEDPTLDTWQDEQAQLFYQATT